MERPLCMNEKDILKQKKLIVSRQPIFSNLKSNTMKNDAKIRGWHNKCKKNAKKLAIRYTNLIFPRKVVK